MEFDVQQKGTCILLQNAASGAIVKFTDKISGPFGYWLVTDLISDKRDHIYLVDIGNGDYVERDGKEEVREVKHKLTIFEEI